VSRDEAVPGLVSVLVSFAIILRRFHRDFASTSSCSERDRLRRTGVRRPAMWAAAQSQLPPFVVRHVFHPDFHRQRQRRANGPERRFADLESGHFLAALCNGSSPVANLQQQNAATKAQPGGDGCDYSRLAKRKQRSMRPTPPLASSGLIRSGLIRTVTCPVPNSCPIPRATAVTHR
jgi:hypothetical protein